MKEVIKDIYDMIDDGMVPGDEWCNELASKLSAMLKARLSEPNEREPALRLSSMGRGERYLYFTMHDVPKEELRPEVRIKFLFGDIIEELFISLIKLSGHDVSHEQEEVELNGVKGHIDCLVDGKLVDIKSASSFSFNKFESGKLYEDDPFGYYAQLAAYEQASGYEAEGWFVMDKQLGKLCFSKAQQFAMPNMAEKIDRVKEMLASGVIPERCDTDKPFQSSGNRQLKPICSYCQFKQHCWRDCNQGHGLRVFLYSNGPVFLTHVARLPKVPEITTKAFGGNDE